MALRFFDGFDHYTGSPSSAGKWLADSGAGTCAVSAGNGRTGASCRLRFASGGSIVSAAAAVDLGSQDTWTIGFAFRVSALPSRAVQILSLYATSTSAYQLALVLNSNGSIQINRNHINAPTTLATSSASLAANTWYYIEFQAVISTSVPANACYLVINGTTVATVAAGTSTRTASPTSADRIIIGAGVGGLLATDVNADYDDLYILDGTGSTQNAPLGDCKVETTFPDAAGASTQFTPSSGNNYAAVNETPPNGDTSYVSTGGTGNRDSYSVGDLVNNPAGVFGVQVNGTARVDASETTRTFSGTTRLSGTYADAAASANLTSTYKCYRFLFPTDPSGADWTGASVNAMEAGVKLVS